MSRNTHPKLILALIVPMVLIGLALWTLPATTYGLTPIQAPNTLPHVPAGQAAVGKVLSIAFAIIGALAVLMITISGLKYITSSGDPQKASEAKNGILYALIGLTVAILAEAIVAFVVHRT